jgi:hypothetical protein
MSSVSVYSQVNLSPFTDISSASGYTAIWIAADDVAMAIDVVSDGTGYNVPAGGSPYPVVFNGGDITQIEATSAFGRTPSGTTDLSTMSGAADSGVGKISFAAVVNGIAMEPGVDLTDQDLTGQDLTGLDLTGADLTNAILTDAI